MIDQLDFVVNILSKGSSSSWWTWRQSECSNNYLNLLFLLLKSTELLTVIQHIWHFDIFLAKISALGVPLVCESWAEISNSFPFKPASIWVKPKTIDKFSVLWTRNSLMNFSSENDRDDPRIVPVSKPESSSTAIHWTVAFAKIKFSQQNSNKAFPRSLSWKSWILNVIFACWILHCMSRFPFNILENKKYFRFLFERGFKCYYVR